MVCLNCYEVGSGKIAMVVALIVAVALALPSAIRLADTASLRIAADINRTLAR